MSQKEFRQDIGGRLRPAIRLPQGFLRLDGYASRPGVYKYRQDDGSEIWELRPDEEVFKAAALSGFEGAPLTNLHPRQLVDTGNVRAVEVGTSTASARRDGDLVAVSMVVKDAKTIGQVERGELNELSPGYKVRIDKTPGVHPKYGRYDQVQRDIEINHLALVPQARGGPELRVRMDAADAGWLRSAVMLRTDAADPAPRADSNVLVTSSVDGHQHTIDRSGSPWPGSSAGWNAGNGETSWSTSEGAEGGHSHSWVKQPDGSILITENQGHTHTVLTPSFQAPVGAPAGRADRASTEQAARPRQGAGATMDPQEQIRQLKTQLETAERDVEQTKRAATEATARADAADARSVQLEKRISDLDEQFAAGARAVETEAVRLQATRADAAEAQVREFDSRLDAAVAERTDVFRKAWQVMGAEFNPGPALTNRQVQVMAIKRMDARADVSDRISDAAISGTFNTLIELRGQTARGYSSIGDAVGRADARVGGSTTPSDQRADARSQRSDAWRNQWRAGLESPADANNSPRGARGGRA